MKVYRCQDCIESVFTAIYNTYADKVNHEDTYLDISGENRLFAEDVEVIPDKEKTIKVMRSLRKAFGEQDYQDLCYAMASCKPEKANSVYHTIVWGLEHKPAKGHLLDHLTDEHVSDVFYMAKNVWRETHHLMGFVRFEETKEKVLYAKIGPKNNVLGFLMTHFSDRLPQENFVIYDDKRGFFGVHPGGKGWFFLQPENCEEVWEKMMPSVEEGQYADLFREFVRTITITERRNYELQRNLLPLRFREYMVEFQ